MARAMWPLREPWDRRVSPGIERVAGAEAYCLPVHQARARALRSWREPCHSSFLASSVQPTVGEKYQ